MTYRVSDRNSPICILCEYPEADGYWFHPVGRWAHEECRNAFRPIEAEVVRALKSNFPDSPRDCALVHSVAIEYVRMHCRLSPDYTINHYTRDRLGWKGVQAYCSIDPLQAVNSCVDLRKRLKDQECSSGVDSSALFYNKMRERVSFIDSCFNSANSFAIKPVPFYEEDWPL